MSRDFDASALVALPRLSAVMAASLLQEVLTAARAEKKLPAALREDCDELARAHQELKAALKQQLVPAAADPAGVRAADIAEDAAFSALFDWTRGWAKLPADVPEAAEARRILDTLYPDGLKFTMLPFKAEWQEAETRLALLSDHKLDESIEKLGGARFLDVLKAAHHAYGEALGITSVRSAPADPPDLRAKRDAAADALRTYVLRVAAQVRKSNPKSAALASRLLAPLSTWQDRASRGGDAAPPPAEQPPPAVA